MGKTETSSLDCSISVVIPTHPPLLVLFLFDTLILVPQAQSLVLFSSVVVSSHLTVKDFKRFIARFIAGPYLTLNSRFLCFYILLIQHLQLEVCGQFYFPR